ncbi:MAG: hypothetical protein ACFB0D_16765 [Phormidesmis sp.]
MTSRSHHLHHPPGLSPKLSIEHSPFPLQAHPWPTGHIFESPGAHLTYRVVGPCCRLYDREQLPWPCCRVQWRSKEPSWRRIGKRFIVDLSTRKHPSYCVEIVGQSYRSEPIVMTMYTFNLSAPQQDWWHTKRLLKTLSTAEESVSIK